MSDNSTPDNKVLDEDESLDFPGGWKGLYIFQIFYGALQVVLLYVFTVMFNRP
ncbi:MAG TPA: hypothetical protein VIG62_10775 [Blastocatellia bacterium]